MLIFVATRTSQTKMAKIGIDARFFGSIGKGLGRYTQKLIENLEKIDQQNQYFIFLRKENFDEYQPQNTNFQKVLADYAWYSFAEQIFFPRILNSFKLDLVHFPHFNVPIFYRGKFVLTIHDLILIHFPTLRGTTLNPLWYRLKYLAYKVAIAKAIQKAETIFTVSEFTKKDILQHYKVPETKIKVTYEASENFCRRVAKNNEKIIEKYGIIMPYVMYVGNAYPHKNLEKFVEAFEIFSASQKNFQLIFVGKEDYFYKRLKEYVAKRKIANIKFLGFVLDDELDVLYRFAGLYVFPSLYEGFGLPPLEAMAKGTPVVSSDHECMREVLGEAAHYVDAREAQKIADGMTKVLSDDFLRKEMIFKGYRQIEKYSWLVMTQQTLEIYNNLLG